MEEWEIAPGVSDPALDGPTTDAFFSDHAPVRSPLAFASPAQRYAATLVDQIVLGVLLVFPVARALSTDRLGFLAIWIPTWFVLALANELVGTTIWGQTLGKRVYSIVVVSRDGSPLGWKRTIKRALGKLVPVPLDGFGILLRRDRTAWHDRFAHSVVIQKPRR